MQRVSKSPKPSAEHWSIATRASVSKVLARSYPARLAILDHLEPKGWGHAPREFKCAKKANGQPAREKCYLLPKRFVLTASTTIATKR